MKKLSITGDLAMSTFVAACLFLFCMVYLHVEASACQLGGAGWPDEDDRVLPCAATPNGVAYQNECIPGRRDCKPFLCNVLYF